jgi:uncharacterized protein YidB (DUF937 family)
MASNPQTRALVMSLITQMRDSGGSNANMNGLLENFNSIGLNDQVNSWIGNGDNKKITPDQVTAAIGADHIAQAARDAGCTPEQASADLAKVLPQIVDTATPNGTLPAPGTVDDMFTRLFSDV